MTQGDIQETFEDKSEIQLHEFINPVKYQILCEALNSSERKWILQGPANKRHYQCTEDDSPILEEAKRFFQSEAFFLVLSNLTGLKLHHLAATPASSDNESESESGTRFSSMILINNSFIACFRWQKMEKNLIRKELNSTSRPQDLVVILNLNPNQV